MAVKFACDIFKCKCKWKFVSNIHWRLLLRVQCRIFQHWFRQWLGAWSATRHYLYQWWPSLLTHICVNQPRWVKWNVAVIIFEQVLRDILWIDFPSSIANLILILYVTSIASPQSTLLRAIEGYLTFWKLIQQKVDIWIRITISPYNLDKCIKRIPEIQNKTTRLDSQVRIYL